MIPILVPIHHVAETMPLVGVYLQKAIDAHNFSHFTVGQIGHLGAKGEVHLWIDNRNNPGNVLVGQFQNLGNQSRYFIHLIGGRGDGTGRFNPQFWLGAMAHLQQWCAAQGCYSIVAMRRPGWGRNIPCKEIGTIVEIGDVREEAEK